MPPTVDFLPVAIATGNNSDTQADFAGSTYQTLGFQYGSVPTSSKQANKVWRQATVIASVIANYIANRLGVNVLDNGDVTTLLANLTMALSPFPYIASIAGNGPVALAGSGTSYTLPAAPTGQLLVLKNGLILTYGAGNDYTVSGTAVTLTVATVAGDVISALF